MLQTMMYLEEPSLNYSSCSCSSYSSFNELGSCRSSLCAMRQPQEEQHPSSSSFRIPHPSAASCREIPMTFDWSDFPIVQRDEGSFFHRPSHPAFGVPEDDDRNVVVMHQPPKESASSEDLISTCSSDSDLSTASVETTTATTEDDEEELSTTTTTTIGASATAANNKLNRRRHHRKVSFATTIHVRTHSVVLGDHPCCAQLALELGWEHDDGQYLELPASAAETGTTSADATSPRSDASTGSWSSSSLCSSTTTASSSTSSSSLKRRSYFERKAILKLVAGMTDEEIRQTTLRHAAPSSRDLSAMQRRG